MNDKALGAHAKASTIDVESLKYIILKSVLCSHQFEVSPSLLHVEHRFHPFLGLDLLVQKRNKRERQKEN